MTTERQSEQQLFSDAEWYDRSINWDARLARELPVLTDVFGPPARGGLLDAGCGTARQARALAQRGYRVTAVDASAEMLARAADPQPPSPTLRLVKASYERLHATVGSGFDGLYCIGNSLAASGSRESARQALEQFARCLRVGGRLFLQLLNFEPVLKQAPTVMGPRVSRLGDVEYVSVRVFSLGGETVHVTNVTLWQERGWQRRTHTGTLYPMRLPELRELCAALNLSIDHLWGDYDRTRFDPERSSDLLLLATRSPD